MKKCSTTTTYIQKLPARCRMLAGTQVEKTHMIRHHKLAIGFFESLKQACPSFTTHRFLTPPVFLRIKSCQSGILGKGMLENAAARYAAKQGKLPLCQPKQAIMSWSTGYRLMIEADGARSTCRRFTWRAGGTGFHPCFSWLVFVNVNLGAEPKQIPNRLRKRN